jgi:hypothetical protein
MSTAEFIALAGFVAAAFAMLQVTQTKERVSWPGWLLPAAVLVPAAIWTGVAIRTEALSGFWALLTGSAWGLQLWFDRLITLTAAFFLLQNRARAAGMKSEVWVLAVIVTGGIGLLVMLARTVYIERQVALHAAADGGAVRER